MDRKHFAFGQYPTDSELDDLHDYAQAAEQALHVDAGIVGALTGLTITQHYEGSALSPDLTVDVSAGAGRDDLGKRIVLAAADNVDCSEDYLGVSTAVTAGYHRTVSIFIKQAITQSNPIAKKSGGTVYRDWTEGAEFEVRQGTETLLASPLDQPATMSGYLLLADVTLINGQTQIVTGDIDLTRRQNFIVLPGSPYTLNSGSLLTSLSALLYYLNTLVAELAATTSSDDGAKMIGAEGITGTAVSLTAGTARSQLTELQAYLDGLRQECMAVRAAAQELTTTGTAYPIAFTDEGYDAAGLFTPDDATGKTVTVDAGTDVWTASSHGYSNNDAVHFTTDGALPVTTPQIVTGQPYYVINKTTHTFKISATPGGAAIDVTNAGGSNNKVHKTQTKITFPDRGRYRVTAWAEFWTHNTGYRELRICTDASGAVTVARTKVEAVQGGYDTCIQVVAANEFEAGTYVQVWAEQLSGTSLVVTNCGLTVEKIGDV